MLVVKEVYFPSGFFEKQREEGSVCGSFSVEVGGQRKRRTHYAGSVTRNSSDGIKCHKPSRACFGRSHGQRVAIELRMIADVGFAYDEHYVECVARNSVRG